MQMLKKIFSSDDKYHLVLDETESSEAVKAEVAPKAVNTPKVKVTTAATAEDNVGPAIAKDKKSGQKKSPKAAAKPQVAKQEVQPTPTPKKSAASSYEPPFWVAAMNNTNNKDSSNGSGQGVEATFASDNLMPAITKYRRVPGASLAKFKAMAKTAKTPRR
jgi:hypothetical protein